MKGVRVLTVVAVTAAGAALCGSAQAARPAKILPNLYSFPGGAGGGPLVTFSVGKDKLLSRGHDRRQVARGITLACTSGAAPAGSIPANQALAIRIPGQVRLVGHRRLAYTGPAMAYPIGSADAPAATTVTFRFAFTGTARSHRALYATGVKGSFTSSACGAPVSFSFPYL
jgi:hypothetical protein